jgi:hypothetical protein
MESTWGRILNVNDRSHTHNAYLKCGTRPDPLPPACGIINRQDATRFSSLSLRFKFPDSLPKLLHFAFQLLDSIQHGKIDRSFIDQ